LGALKGNAFDIASLQIALLRASGIPARYVHGTIDVPKDKFLNWVGGFTNVNAAITFAASGGIPIGPVTSGGQITKLRMEHIWVEAAIDYQPSRGAKNKDADSWVQMDPSFKQYDFLDGLDPIAISGLNPQQVSQNIVDSGTVNQAEGWIMGLDSTIIQSVQNEVKTSMEQYIANNFTDPTVGDVIGGQRVIEADYPTLSSSLPNRIVVDGARYGSIPDQLQHKISFAFQKDILDQLVDPITFPWTQVNNQKVTLSFISATPEDEQALLSYLPEGELTDISQLPSSIPSYLVNVIPQLSINEEIVKQGSPMQLGEELPFTFSINYRGHGVFPYTYSVISGSYLSVAVIGGNVSPLKLQSVKTKIEQTKAIVESGDQDTMAQLTREDILGDLFHTGLLSYYSQLISLAHTAGLQLQAKHYLAAGYGTFGYEPNVDYFFGIPRAIIQGGAVMNIPMLNVSGVDSIGQNDRENFSLQVGVLSSALEHFVPEALFHTDPSNPPEAISAVKAIAKANGQGQKIFHITSENQASTLPYIHHASATMDEIRTSLAAGKEVITHTDAVNIPGWSGAGYIIIDPITGDGAYKISGGANGSYLSGPILAGFFVLGFIGLLAAAALFATFTWIGLVIGLVLGLASALLLHVVDIYSGTILDSRWTAVEMVAAIALPYFFNITLPLMAAFPILGVVAMALAITAFLLTVLSIWFAPVNTSKRPVIRKENYIFA
jgi:hypothetical protein